MKTSHSRRSHFRVDAGLVALAVAVLASPLAAIAATITQQAYLKASNPGASNEFGWPVAISRDTVVVGARQEDSSATGVNGNQNNNSAPDSGAAYVFVRRGTNWMQQAYLKASNTGTDHRFGASAAISGDTIVVGAQAESSNATGVNGNQSDNSAPRSGAAYVFVRRGTNWMQQAYLKASNTDASNYFGRAVAVSGDTVVVGAPRATNSGAAYVFVRRGTTWTQQAYLKASNPGADDRFGYAVAISGDTVVVGADGEDSNATGVNGNQSDNSATNSGAAYVFARRGTNWTQQAYLKALSIRPEDGFGVKLSVSGDTAVVGGGGARVFVRRGTNWTPQADLQGSNSRPDDYFGYGVGVAGDTVVVGAYQESSNAIGVNGDQNDHSATNSGAAYVFVRRGTNWTQQAYLKASNTGAGDGFGGSVAVADETIVVGALRESSNATGVNGNQNDNSSSHSGAAYIFTGLGLGNPVGSRSGR